MSESRLITIEGPKLLPLAAAELLTNPDVSGIRAKGFIALKDIAPLLSSGDKLAPPPEIYSDSIQEAFSKLGDVVAEWGKNTFIGGLILDATLTESRLSGAKSVPHIDKPSAAKHGVLPGPLTASIALKGAGLWQMASTRSLLDPEGYFSVEEFNRLHLAIRNGQIPPTSSFLQQPTDLIMWRNMPHPTMHGVPKTTPGRKAGLYTYLFTPIPTPYRLTNPVQLGSARKQSLRV